MPQTALILIYLPGIQDVLINHLRIRRISSLRWAGPPQAGTILYAMVKRSLISTQNTSQVRPAYRLVIADTGSASKQTVLSARIHDR
jgi:hypothetical protein